MSQNGRLYLEDRSCDDTGKKEILWRAEKGIDGSIYSTKKVASSGKMNKGKTPAQLPNGRSTVAMQGRGNLDLDEDNYETMASYRTAESGEEDEASAEEEEDEDDDVDDDDDEEDDDDDDDSGQVTPTGKEEEEEQRRSITTRRKHRRKAQNTWQVQEDSSKKQVRAHDSNSIRSCQTYGLSWSIH